MNGFLWLCLGTRDNEPWRPHEDWELRCGPWEGGRTEQCSFKYLSNHWQCMTALQGRRHLSWWTLPHTEDVTSSKVLSWSILSPPSTHLSYGGAPTETGPNACERGTGKPPTPHSTHQSADQSLTTMVRVVLYSWVFLDSKIWRRLLQGTLDRKEKQGLAIHTHFPTGSKMGKD